MSKDLLPDNWNQTRLVDLADIVSGGTPSRDNPDFWVGGTIPWATPTDITKDSRRILADTFDKITESGLRNSSAKLLPPGSLLMTSRATLGEIKISETEVCTNQGFKSLIVKRIIDKWFLYYQMKLLKPRFKALGIGSTFLEVNKKDTENFIIPLAPLHEQRKIARILTTVDTLIEKTEALIHKYESIKQGMMNDLFTRGVDDDGRLRSSYEKAPELYWKSELGWIPRGWAYGNINDFCEIYNHLRKPISSEEREGIRGQYPYYGPTGVLDYINEYRVEGKFVLIGEDGDHFLKFDRQQMTILIDGKFNVNNHAHILKGSVDCLTEWIHTYFCHRDITYYLTRQGAGRLKLNKSALQSIPMLLPKLDEQSRIIDRFNSQNKKILKEQTINRKLNMIKRGLMQDLLTGKIRVSADKNRIEFEGK
ncbi:restriction endonuclease subunit S [bacterium]|nr:restriction endonuclease subunit S [bacterium]